MADWKAVVNGHVVLPHGIVRDGVVLMKGAVIVDCGPQGSVEIPEGAELIDAGNHYVGPGFIDIHCHGGGGFLGWEHPYEFALFHMKFGTTGILPTLVYNQSRQSLLDGVRAIMSVEDRPFGSAIVGIHMEGPFINPKYGAITSPIRPVDPEEYETLLSVAGNRIKIWTLAPELPGQRQFAEAAAAYGIVLSVGHSEADAETIFSFVPQGLRLGCHCTNATGITPHPSRFGGTREIGVDEAVLVHDDLYAEVIPDEHGIHVRPLMCRLIHKAKGTDRVIIVTDATDNAGLPFDPDGPDGPYADVRMIEGVGLSGSKLTMNKAVRNMMDHTGIGMREAFIMGSLNPARLLGIDREVGSLERGKRANLIVVTERMDVRAVVFEGQVML